MSDHSAIEWTDAPWNPVRGCTKVSPGCKFCYAETFAERFREGYIGKDKDLPDISLNQVMVAANYIEMLGTERFRRKKPEGARRAKRPEISGTVSLNTGEPIGEEAIRAKEVQEQLASAMQGSLFDVNAAQTNLV